MVKMSTQEAFDIVGAIARERDPYTAAQDSRNRPENNPETIRALCVVLASLMDGQGAGRRLPTGGMYQATRLKRPLHEYLSQLEKEAILEALEEADYNKTKAAELLGLSFRQLRYKLETHQMRSTEARQKRR